MNDFTVHERRMPAAPVARDATPQKPQTPELNKAFAAARLEMKQPRFDSVNPHFKSPFASLASVQEACIPPCAKHGIAVHQDVTDCEDGVRVVTLLCHASGEERRFGPWRIPTAKPDAQGYGSARTYACRYQLLSVMGLTGEIDDDGNAAVAGALSADQVKELEKLLKKVGSDKSVLLQWAKVDTLEEMPATAFERAKQQLEAKIAKQAKAKKDATA